MGNLSRKAIVILLIASYLKFISCFNSEELGARPIISLIDAQ